MKIDELPVFTILTVRPDSPQLMGEVNRWRWIGAGHSAYLYLGDGRFVEGRFHDVDESTRSVSFAFKNPDAAPDIQPGESIRYIDGYWGERAIIALDRSLAWQEATFKPCDVLKTFPNGRQEEIAGGWDHEHCAICWAVISQKENTIFMKSCQDDCVCFGCFRNYVEPRKIDFIEEA